MRWLIPAALISSLMVPSAFAQLLTSEQATIAKHPAWTAPQKPLRIYGNTWYVGPHGLTVLLITAPTGDVLIDGGVPVDAALIEANIRDLGINLHDVKWILNSHAHFDHAGGIAQIAHDTGAQVIASAVEASLLGRGGHDDPEYGDKFPFMPVHVASKATDAEPLHLGDLTFTTYLTPGHTKGNTTWTWTSCQSKRCLLIVDIGSLSAPDYQLIGNPKYPAIVKDFEYSFAMVGALPCDIALSPHPEVVNMWVRVAKRKRGNADALIDSTGCRAYAKVARKAFEAQLAKQRARAGLAKNRFSSDF